MFIGECADRCRYPLEGGVDFNLIDAYFTGAATVIDSITAIDKLVFKEKRYSLPEFVQILKGNFAGHSLLQAELKNKFPKFGNDDEEGDRYAAPAMNAVPDALDEIDWPEGYIPVGGFYSLYHHRTFGWNFAPLRMAGWQGNTTVRTNLRSTGPTRKESPLCLPLWPSCPSSEQPVVG